MRPFLNLFQPSAHRGPRSKARYFQAAVEDACGRRSANSGNIIVYIVMVMLIFAGLGVVMLSLFSTASSSSATANNIRRAFNLYESGYRYALSELTATGFSSSSITALNTTTYKLPPEGEFILNVFGPWFDSTAYQDRSAGQPLNLKVFKGNLPPGFTIPAGPPYVSVVNFDYVGATIPASASAEVTDYSYTDATHFSLTVRDDFVANNNERICLAVHPDAAQALSNGGNLTVEGQARGIFPKRNGAIVIKRNLLFYRELVDPGGTQVILKNLSSKSGSFPAVTASDYAILSPANYYIVPEGRSGEVTYGTNIDYATNIYDTTAHPEDSRPDIDFGQEDHLSSVMSQNKSYSGFAAVDDVEKKVTFAQTSGNPFASVLFNDTRAIGGQKNYCDSGACLFQDGIRAFFLMNFGSVGDGFTFSLLSAEPNPAYGNSLNNTSTSVGGDFQLSELLGYAGDSRTNNNSPPTYLDGTGNGLRAPKMAVQFDGVYNNSPVAYCSDSTNANLNTRFDPAISGGARDNVTYVYWGSRNQLSAPCRNNYTYTSPLYDDNRHYSQENSATKKWNITVGAATDTYVDYPDGNRRLAIYTSGTNADGTIYVLSGDDSSNADGRVRAVRPDGSIKWTFQPGLTGIDQDDDPDSITLDAAGNIYVGSDDDKLISLNSSGTQRWVQSVDNDIESPIAISETRNEVYAVTQTGTLYAFDKTTGTPSWQFYNPEGSEVFGGVTIDPTDGTLYFGTDTGRLYAIRSTGSQRWSYLTPSTEPIRSRPSVNPANRDIIFGSNNNYVYALPYSSSSTPALRWQRQTNGDVLASPTITPDGSRVYVGNSAGVFYALNASNGSILWTYPTSGSIGAIKGAAAVDVDGTIYFGTESGRLYALDPSGALKWRYTADSAIRAEAKIGLNGIVYFVSANGTLYAVNPYTNPLNDRSLYLSDNELNAGVSDSNWFGQGPWAVRVEVDRSQTQNANNKYEYTLRTWIRKCPDTNCTGIADTLFSNTRLRYDYLHIATPQLPMTQTIELSGPETTSGTDQALFKRFLFGFTSASGSSQTINITRFQLGFIRPNDPVVTSDPNWP
jgi:outer membrane protein assembly factor BamB